MEKGISTWLFSKIVMLIFLVLVFSSVIEIMNIIGERAFADSAGVIAVNIKDAIQGVITTGALSGQRVVPLPKRIPEDIEQTRAREYTIVIDRDTTANTISIAVAWGSFGPNSHITSYVSAAMLFIQQGVNINVPPQHQAFPIVLNSSDFRFFVVNKTTVAGNPQIYIGGCRKTGLTECTE